MEKIRPIEGLKIVLPTLALIGISFFAFSNELKMKVRREQKGVCADCGEKPSKLTIHHIIPQSMGGPDTRDNAVGLCRECHDFWDEQARNGVFFNISKRK